MRTVTAEPLPTYTVQIDRLLPWEPEVVPLITPDGRSHPDLLGVVRSDTRDLIGHVSVTSSWRPRTHRQIGAALDRFAAALGIDPASSPVRVSQWGPSGEGITRESYALTVTDPVLLDHMRVPTDPSARTIAWILRTSHDLSLATTDAIGVVRAACTNGCLFGGRADRSYARHTSGSTARLDRAIDASAARLGERIASYGDLLRRLSARVLSLLDVASIAARIVGVVDGTEPTGPQTALVGRIVDMVRDADGSYVPGHRGPGEADALQVLEACTAYDRHVSDRPHRVIEGRSLGADAVGVLSVL